MGIMTESGGWRIMGSRIIPPMENRSETLHELLNMGEIMLTAGAEVSRVEGTLSTLGHAYGASTMNVFAITATLVVTMEFPDGERLTQTRRIWGPGVTDYRIVAACHKLAKRCAKSPLGVADLAREIEACKRQPADRVTFFVGSIAAAAGFAVFFGGSIVDAAFAGIFAILICVLQERMAPRCPNTLIFDLLCSLVAGIGTCAAIAVCETAAGALFGFGVGASEALRGGSALIHLDKILIGEVMLLIPGIYMTNAIRDMIVGDTVSGTMRFVETMLWAIALAGGFMTALFIFDGSHSVGPGLALDPMGIAVQLISAFFGAAGFAMIFHLPRKHLAAASIGGILSWAIYLAMGTVTTGIFLPALVASAFSAFYAEALARWRDVPSLLFVIPTVVPLIPGAPLYYMMSFAVAADWPQVAEYALRTGQFALGIAAGMCVTWVFASLLKPRPR